MKKITAITSLCFCMLLLSANAMAWGTTGHRVVSEVAERHLSKKAKQNLHALIGKQKLAYWANWADNQRSDTTGKWKHTTGTWHYINLPGNLTQQAFYDAVRNYPTESVYTQIDFLKNKVKDRSLSKEERKDYLAFLIHFTGDLHQPMHIGRADDLGGNKVSVNWFGKSSNLHTVWDTDLVDFQKWSYTEYATVLDIVSQNEVRNIQSGSMLDWLYETYQLTNEIYRVTPFGSNLSYQYTYYYTDKMNLQLLRAGLRLAKILNEVLI